MCGIVALSLVSSGYSQSPLAEALHPLEEPTLANAKKSVEQLADHVGDGEESQSGLARLVAKSVKNLFTAEYKLSIAVKKAQELEDEAAEWANKADQWLIPTSLGRINYSQSRAAEKRGNDCLEQAKRVTAEAQAGTLPSLRQIDEVILSLRANEEFEAAVILVNVLQDVRHRSGLEEVFTSSVKPEALADMRELLEKREEWLTEARNAEEAGSYLPALLLYHKAKDAAAYKRAAGAHAKELERQELVGSAIDYYTLAGRHDEVGRLRDKYPDLGYRSFKNLDAEEIFATMAPKVVRVRTVSSKGKGHGSGFFVWRGGYILTNNHVVDGAREVTVITNDSIEYPAKVVGSRSTPDLALLKIDLDEHGLVLLASDDEVKTGLGIALLGYPIKDIESATLNTGRISNTNRFYQENPVFQLDLSANHGNSGGPVVDTRGRLVGVMTFGLGDFDVDRFNFAIRVDTVREFLEEKMPGGYR